MSDCQFIPVVFGGHIGCLAYAVSSTNSITLTEGKSCMFITLSLQSLLFAIGNPRD